MNISKKEGKKFNFYYLSLLIILIFVILLGFLIKAEDSEDNVEWRMFRKYLNHTAWDGVDFTVISGLNYSVFVTEGNVRSSPAVVNGYVYIGSDDGNLYQLNASNISQQIANRTMGDGVPSSPAIVNGYVYIGIYSELGDYHNVYQLNASNISLPVVSSSTTASYWVYSSPAVANGYVYIGDYDSQVYQLNATNISQKIATYTISTSSLSLTSSPAVANGYVYIGGDSETGNLYQLNASNISQKIANYTVAIGSNVVSSSPAVANGSVYIGGSSNFYQLNASNISQKIASFATAGAISSSPAVANGYVYVGSEDFKVYQLNASNVSQKIASYQTGSFIHSSPAVANGYVYIGSDDGYIYQLNASNISQFVGKVYSGADIHSSPAYAKDYIYFGSGLNVYQVNASNLSLFTLVDTTPPAVTIFSPTAGLTYSSTTVPITISLSELSYCEYSINGGVNNYTLLPNVHGASVAMSWSGATNALSNGYYTLNVYCNDTAGNRNDTANVSFWVYTAPTAPTTPTPGGGIVAGQPTQTHTWDTIIENEPATMPIIVPEIHLIEITVVTIETLTGASLTVTKIDVTPQSDILIRADGENYQGFKIDTTKINETNIANVTIKFRVNKTWLQELNLTYDDVSLYRKPGKPNKWDALNTSFVSEDSEYYYFSAVSPGFSTFVIFIGTKPCNPGDIRCFNNELQLCVGDYTWVITKKCRGGCENNECIRGSILDISSGSLLVYIVVVILTLGLLVVLYFVFRFLSKKRSRSVWKGSKRTEVQHKI